MSRIISEFSLINIDPNFMKNDGIDFENFDRSWKLKAVSIYSGIEKDLVQQRLKAGEISGCGPSVPWRTGLREGEIHVGSRGRDGRHYNVCRQDGVLWGRVRGAV